MNYFSRQRWQSIWVIVLIVLNLTTLFFLVQDKVFSEPRRQQPLEKVKEFLVAELSMSAEQIEDFDDATEVHHKNMRSLHDQQKRLKRGIIDELGASTSDALDKKIMLIGENQMELDREMHRHFSVIRDLLSPEQKKKFDDVIGKALERGRGPNHGHGPPSGPPPHRRP